MNFHLPIRLIGMTASPYTRKMVALLRFRRLPYQVTWNSPAAVLVHLGVTPPKPILMPTFLAEGEGQMHAVCDSTPIIRQLEQQHDGRSVLPTDGVARFLDFLIEDFADEWCTKYMFHYRWHYEDDAEKAGTILPLCVDTTLAPESLNQQKLAFTQRQIDRLYVVGSNETTAPVIDASYRRFLEALENLLVEQPFVAGRRPGAGDFALYGQLTQLVDFDPTPSAIAQQMAPRVLAWVQRVEDLSGMELEESGWMTPGANSQSYRAILNEIGRVYAPALLANAAAYEKGAPVWQTSIDGATWRQQTFPYQVKCLRWIRDEFGELSDDNKARALDVLSGTGCEALVAPVN